MSVLINSLPLFAIILSYSLTKITSSPGYAIGYTSTTNYRLNIIGKITDEITKVECASLCSSKWSQISYNFVKNGNSGLGRCEIFEISRDDAPLATFISDPNSVYYERFKVIPDPCTPNPCYNNGTCTLKKSGYGPDFECNCSFPMGGKICKNLTCNGEICTSFGNTVYFYNKTHSSWQDAVVHCSARGMQLATPKSDEAFDSIHEFLLNMYKGNESLEQAYWLGLYRNATNKPFKWIDGTPLETNSKKWCSSRPMNDPNTFCVEVANGKFKWFMDEELCEGEGWAYGRICQQNYTL